MRLSGCCSAVETLSPPTVFLLDAQHGDQQLPHDTSYELGCRLLLCSSIPVSHDADAAAISGSSFLLPPPLFSQVL